MTPRHALEAFMKVFGLYLLVRIIQDLLLTSIYIGIPLRMRLEGLLPLLFPLILSVLPLLLVFKTHWFTKLLRIQSLETPLQAPSLRNWFAVGIVALAGAKLFLAVFRMLGLGTGLLMLYMPGGVPDAWRTQTLSSSITQIATQALTIALCLLALRYAPQIAHWLDRRQQG